MLRTPAPLIGALGVSSETGRALFSGCQKLRVACIRVSTSKIQACWSRARRLWRRVVLCPPLGYPRETSVGPGSPRVHASPTAYSRCLATESAAFVRSRNAKVGRGVNETRQKHWIVAMSLLKRSHLALGSKGSCCRQEQARAWAKSSGLACQGSRQ